MIPIRRCTFQLLTDEPMGHTLNRRQVLSPNAEWIAFDGRNDDTHIGQTRHVGRVHWPSKKVEILYEAHPASEFGPGVGAVAYHPHLDKVIFIHGLTNYSSQTPYRMDRRFGAIVDCHSPSLWKHAESRCVSDSPGPGILSGGTHAHSWSPSGNRVSFTYNDALDPQMPRTVGFLVPTEPPSNRTPSETPEDAHENFTGTHAAFLILRPVSNSNGNDANGLAPCAVEQAVEECWVHEHQIAFLGTVRTARSDYPTLQEVFLASIPSDDTWKRFLQRESTDPRPRMRIERCTYTEHWVHPGVQGPRHWLTPSPSGDSVYSLAKDNLGCVQVIRISLPADSHTPAEIEWLTALEHSVENQIALDRTGRYLSFVSDGHIHVLDLPTRKITKWCETSWLNVQGECIENLYAPTTHGNTIPQHPSHVEGMRPPYIGGVHFVDANRLVVNRYIDSGYGCWLQIGMLQAID